MSESNGTRMAGDKLAQKERNAAARAKTASNPEKLEARLSSIDRDAYDLSGYSDTQINDAFRGGTFDATDYARLTGEDAAAPVEDTVAEEVVEDIPMDADPENEAAADNIVKNFMEKKGQGIGPGGGSLYGSGMSQNVNQDNDITTNVTGDNNTVENNQNNRVSQGGGNDYAASFANRLKDQYVLNLRGK